MWPWRASVLARNWPKFPNPRMAILSTAAAAAEWWCWVSGCDWEAASGDMGGWRERRRKVEEGVKERRGKVVETEGGKTGREA